MGHIIINSSDLVVQHLHIVHWAIVDVIKGINSNPFMSYDDFFQVGSFALMRAADTYNGSIAFEGYARKCVRNALISYARKYSINENTNNTFSLDATIEEYEGQIHLHDIVASKLGEFYREHLECVDLMIRLASKYDGVAQKGIYVILFRYFGYSDSQIASLFGIKKQNHIRAWAARAKSYLINNQTVVDFFGKAMIDTMKESDTAC